MSDADVDRAAKEARDVEYRLTFLERDNGRLYAEAEAAKLALRRFSHDPKTLFLDIRIPGIQEELHRGIRESLLVALRHPSGKSLIQTGQASDSHGWKSATLIRSGLAFRELHARFERRPIPENSSRTFTGAMRASFGELFELYSAENCCIAFSGSAGVLDWYECFGAFHDSIRTAPILPAGFSVPFTFVALTVEQVLGLYHMVHEARPELLTSKLNVQVEHLRIWWEEAISELYQVQRTVKRLLYLAQMKQAVPSLYEFYKNCVLLDDAFLPTGSTISVEELMVNIEMDPSIADEIALREVLESRRRFLISTADDRPKTIKEIYSRLAMELVTPEKVLMLSR